MIGAKSSLLDHPYEKVKKEKSGNKCTVHQKNLLCNAWKRISCWTGVSKKQIHVDRFTMSDPSKRPFVSSNALFNFLACIFVLWIVFTLAMTTLWGKMI